VFRRTRPRAGDGGLDDLAQRIDAGSVAVIDEEGGEDSAESFIPSGENGAAVIVLNGVLQNEGAESVTYQATFQGLRGKEVREFRFRFTDRTFEKAVPFEIRDLELP
jgi:hypothetical protein